jgi:hypothetical protein
MSCISGLSRRVGSGLLRSTISKRDLKVDVIGRVENVIVSKDEHVTSLEAFLENR